MRYEVQDETRTWVAFEKKEIVGWGIASQYYDHGKVAMVYVRRSQRRQGIGASLLREIRQDMMSLMNAALEASSKVVADGSEQYVISGERNLLAVRDLSQDMSRMRQLFELFEHKTSLVQILDLSLRGEGVQIFIGGESGVTAPDEVSVVTAPYKVGGDVVGTVGVIGPTRMAYDRVVPIVDVTAKLLSSALSQP